jgi:hypothetical protein
MFRRHHCGPLCAPPPPSTCCGCRHRRACRQTRARRPRRSSQSQGLGEACHTLSGLAKPQPCQARHHGQPVRRLRCSWHGDTGGTLCPGRRTGPCSPRPGCTRQGLHRLQQAARAALPGVARHAAPAQEHPMSWAQCADDRAPSVTWWQYAQPMYQGGTLQLRLPCPESQECAAGEAAARK